MQENISVPNHFVWLWRDKTVLYIAKYRFFFKNEC